MPVMVMVELAVALPATMVVMELRIVLLASCRVTTRYITLANDDDTHPVTDEEEEEELIALIAELALATAAGSAPCTVNGP